MLAPKGSLLTRYGWLRSTSSVMPTLLDLLCSSDKNIPGLLYLLILLLSGLMLPLAAPVYLAPAVSDIAANLLSSNVMPRHLASYHSAAIIPVIIMAAYQGYLAIKQKQLISEKTLHYLLLPMLTLIAFSGLSDYAISYWEIGHITLSYDKTSIREIRKLVGDRPVSAQMNIGMFFANREYIYPFPAKTALCDAIILQISLPFQNLQQEHLGYLYGEPRTAYLNDLRQWMDKPDWHVAYWQAPWLVMMRGTPSPDEPAMRTDILNHIHAFAERQSGR